MCLLLLWGIRLESQCSYPFLHQADQDRISGSVGERRSGDRYNYGIDFNLSGGTGAARNLEVYAIEDGPLFKISTTGLDQAQSTIDQNGNTVPVIDPLTGMQLMSVNHTLSVGNYGYLYIRTDPSIQSLANGASVSKGTLLGTIEP